MYLVSTYGVQDESECREFSILHYLRKIQWERVRYLLKFLPKKKVSENILLYIKGLDALNYICKVVSTKQLFSTDIYKFSK